MVYCEMDKLYSPSAMARIGKKHGFRRSKGLGQNFLSDKNIIDLIIEGSDIGPQDLIIEIGPGMGALTMAAAEKAEKVIAVEIDRRLIPVLNDTLSGCGNVDIINADIMKLDLTELIDANRTEGRVRVIGNLPYYITTPIIMKLLEERVPADSMTVMLQKEVADRIKASPASRTYGALTLTVEFYCTVSHIADAPKEVFVPRPKVDSTVIRLDIRDKRPVELTDEKIFFETIRSGFGQRRKMLLNSLTGVRGMPKERIAEVLSSAGIDGSRRAETLSLTEFAAVANEIADRL